MYAKINRRKYYLKYLTTHHRHPSLTYTSTCNVKHKIKKIKQI